METSNHWDAGDAPNAETQLSHDWLVRILHLFGVGEKQTRNKEPNSLLCIDTDAEFMNTRDSSKARKYLNVAVTRCDGRGCSSGGNFEDFT